MEIKMNIISVEIEKLKGANYEKYFFNQRRLFMKTKTKGFLLTAGVCLAMAFTLSCSSDDWLGDPSSSSNGGGEPSSSSGGGGDPSSSSNGGGNSIIYEDETYPTVVIGNQIWFARNLNYNAPGSKCYGEDGYVYDYDEETDDYIERALSDAEIQANCQKYGRLYDWATAMGIDADFNWDEWGGSDVKHKGICPTGWHLPSNDDWDELFLYVDSQNDGEGSGGSSYDSYTAGKYLKATDGWNWNDYEEISGNGTDKYGFSALPGGGGYSDGSFGSAGVSGFWWSASETNSSNAYYRIMYYNFEYARWYDYDKSLLFSVRCVKD